MYLQIAEAYKRKIEAIVRKPSGAGRGAEEEETEPLSPCPHCGCRSPVTALECTQCLGRIPYCIVTGLRMAVHDWTICPSCRFSALYTKFLSVITAEKVCLDGYDPILLIHTLIPLNVIDLPNVRTRDSTYFHCQGKEFSKAIHDKYVKCCWWLDHSVAGWEPRGNAEESSKAICCVRSSWVSDERVGISQRVKFMAYLNICVDGSTCLPGSNSNITRNLLFWWYNYFEHRMILQSCANSCNAWKLPLSLTDSGPTFLWLPLIGATCQVLLVESRS